VAVDRASHFSNRGRSEQGRAPLSRLSPHSVNLKMTVIGVLEMLPPLIIGPLLRRLCRPLSEEADDDGERRNTRGLGADYSAAICR
jgi:hypothetical protein